ncbi:hypothetical protein [Aureimonas mangrovi]|uniref:hypothetical protein n=1 Tax=Aureimonas mangrovi TaxID=2758041 RepID=UPI001AEDD145|nr:hypothetical protein [Aureimonas mangrovi]
MSRKTSLVLMAFLIIACYAVPYLFLGGVTGFAGAFLFWTLAGLAVIALNAVATAGFVRGNGR